MIRRQQLINRLDAVIATTRRACADVMLGKELADRIELCPVCELRLSACQCINGRVPA